MKICSAGFTHVGRRTNNEDAFCSEPSLGLFVVADGMGGYEGGEIASRVVVETVKRFVRASECDDNTTWPYPIDPKLSSNENMLRMAIRVANDEVVRRKTGVLESMGSTVALVLVRGGESWVANVGDSRVYRLREGRLIQCSQDHSLYAEMRAMNLVVGSREEFAYSNVITRAIGMRSHAEPFVAVEPIRVGDTFLVCSDGLYEALDDESLAQLMAIESLDEAAQTLVEEAFTRGGRDNITAVLLRAMPDVR
jgi:serine/threonine protein phosphatase PrpC